MSAFKIRTDKVGGSGVHAGNKVMGTGSRKPEAPAIPQFRSQPCDIVNGHNGYKGSKSGGKY